MGNAGRVYQVEVAGIWTVFLSKESLTGPHSGGVAVGGIRWLASVRSRSSPSPVSVNTCSLP